MSLQGRGKKDAKQVSAAAVLEMLLVNVPESDFLMPGKAKQTKTVQPSLRAGRQSDFSRGRGRLRPTGGRYMSQHNTADYVDSQLISSYNDSPYYGVDGYANTEGTGYANSAGFAGVNASPQSFHIPQQQQQAQGFGMNVNGVINNGMVSSGPLGHVGDNRGLSAQFQQVGLALSTFEAMSIWTHQPLLCGMGFVAMLVPSRQLVRLSCCLQEVHTVCTFCVMI